MTAPAGERFRKKPVVIEAWQIGSLAARPDWLYEAHKSGSLFGNGDDYFEIVTLEGKMRGERGDWLIRGVKGELYPCKPDIFAATYEPADSPSPAGEVNETAQRLIDRDEIWTLFVNHYWDSFQKDRDLILCHVDAVLRMTPAALPKPSGEEGLREALAERDTIGASPYDGTVTIDARVLHALWCYGNLHPVTGVIYQPGSHQECLAQVDAIFWKRAQIQAGAKRP